MIHIVQMSAKNLKNSKNYKENTKKPVLRVSIFTSELLYSKVLWTGLFLLELRNQIVLLDRSVIPEEISPKNEFTGGEKYRY